MKKQLYCNPILEKWEKERLHRLHIKMRDVSMNSGVPADVAYTRYRYSKSTLQLLIIPSQGCFRIW